ncbi:hypothetical protein QBC43DRAFT_292619 [Cladorrhinum sp. PSN259]|nr:hypothetical protein QBC43DRAFT_292619 [Cladorrhinum sp. PSN259]
MSNNTSSSASASASSNRLYYRRPGRAVTPDPRQHRDPPTAAPIPIPIPIRTPSHSRSPSLYYPDHYMYRTQAQAPTRSRSTVESTNPPSYSSTPSSYQHDIDSLKSTHGSSSRAESEADSDKNPTNPNSNRRSRSQSQSPFPRSCAPSPPSPHRRGMSAQEHRLYIERSREAREQRNHGTPLLVGSYNRREREREEWFRSTTRGIGGGDARNGRWTPPPLVVNMIDGVDVEREREVAGSFERMSGGFGGMGQSQPRSQRQGVDGERMGSGYYPPYQPAQGQA